MKKQTVIIIVAIVALALLWYFFVYKKNQTAGASPVVAPGIPQAAPVSQAAVVNGPPAQLATATGASQTLATPATALDVSTAVQPVYTTAIDSSQYDAIILPWMNSLGVNNKQQALAMYPQMTQTEKATLADIITNVWGGKRPQTSADTQFWNTWRVKYHILDGTYNPFSGGDPQKPYMGVNNMDNPQDAYVSHDIDPLTPVSNSQQPNNFKIKGSSQTAYNGFKKARKKK